jgi:hypothetical protein
MALQTLEDTKTVAYFYKNDITAFWWSRSLMVHNFKKFQDGPTYRQLTQQKRVWMKKSEQTTRTEVAMEVASLSVCLLPSLLPPCAYVLHVNPEGQRNRKIPNPKTRNPKPGTFSQIFIYKTLSLEPGSWGWNPTHENLKRLNKQWH